MSLLAALAMAQFAVVQKNVQASTYISSYSELRECAESGIGMALHDIKHNFSGNSGSIGTVGWATANDCGSDGQAGTYDEGEADGVPTLGEPNVAAVPFGPTALGAGLTVYVADTGWADVQRVVATASNANASATVSTYVKTIITVPRWERCSSIRPSRSTSRAMPS
jgi:hypothetical protein